MKTDYDGELRACAKYADRLVDLSDGELSDEERPSVEAHVADCAGCQAELARLDASLVVLRRTGFQPVPDGTRSVRTTYYAALCLLLLLVVGFVAIRFLGGDHAPQTARAIPQPQSPDRVAVFRVVDFDEAAALHQIALIEQQARLQASLDLMPKDPWFAEQRAANEELLARIKAAVTSAQVNSHEAAPTTDRNLDEGETL